MRKRIQTSFGFVIKKRRRELRFSQEELAHRADMHRTYVADIERGARNPSLLAIVRLVLALGLSLGAFFAIVDSTLDSEDADVKQHQNNSR